MALMLYTGQRRSDAVLLGPEHLKNGWLIFTQQKNKKRKPIRMEIPVRPELRSILAASATGKETFLVTEFNKPFTSNGFGNWFRKQCDAAGLSHCTAHGLRKAAAARLAELGAPENEIMAITGHRTSKEITRYTRGARQRVLAENAMARFAHPNVSHSSPKSGKVPHRPEEEIEIFDEINRMVPRAGSNHRHCDFQSHALPTELPGRRPEASSGRAPVYSETERSCPATCGAFLAPTGVKISQ